MPPGKREMQIMQFVTKSGEEKNFFCGGGPPTKKNFFLPQIEIEIEKMTRNWSFLCSVISQGKVVALDR